MPLVAGSVTVSPAGVATFAPPAGANLAREIYTEFINNFSADASPNGEVVELPSGAEGAATRHGVAVLATRLAAAVVAHVVANAAVTVTIGVADAGLQRDPAAPNDPTLAPAAPVQITGTVA